MNKHNKLIQNLTHHICDVSHITRDNLEKLGAWLDQINAKRNITSSFKPVNIHDNKLSAEKKQYEKLLKIHTLNTSTPLLTGRFATYGQYIKKIMPDDKYNQVIDNVFKKIAQLACVWSKLDLPNECRFANLQQLNEQEHLALATAIANQNRALATLGGASNIIGLAGLVVDNLWLLLVSLRSIYQTAEVYNQPLTGTQGIQIAYDILAHANLNKIQEKQTLLIAIGLGKNIFNNTEKTGWYRQMNNLSLNETNLNYYVEQIVEIADHFNIDLDRLNNHWLNKLVSLTVMSIAMHYNSQLIDEVLGVARATFAPPPKLAKLA